MKRIMAIALAAASASLAAGAPLSAQRIAPNQFAIDGAIGFVIPAGNYGTGLNTGLDLMVGLEYRPAQTGPFSFRAEIGWDHFGVTGLTASSSITHLAIDGIYDFVIPNSLLQPYALAGFGIYNVCGEHCGGMRHRRRWQPRYLQRADRQQHRRRHQPGRRPPLPPGPRCPGLFRSPVPPGVYRTRRTE